MSTKNETLILVLSLLTTMLLIAGGFWWFTRKSNVDLNKIISSDPNNSISGSKNQTQNTSEQPRVKNFASVPNIPTGLFNYGGSTSWAPI